MRIWVHRYRLVPRRRLSSVAAEGARTGALLRVLSDAGEEGFADLHPWPELGDLSLDAQLTMLARGERTSQLRASLALAKLDGAARARQVSLFEGLTIPLSHWPGADPPAGFDTVKIKDAASIPEHIRIRIDFNARLTPAQFVEIARALPKDRVDFVEDPCAYDAETWRQLRAETGLRLALDRGVGREGFDVFVHKPALHEEWPRTNAEIVVTSYMDHPVGQFGAAYVAAAHKMDGRSGLMTHELYEPDAFIERIERNGARLLPPAGTGIGFDDLLENLPWMAL